MVRLELFIFKRILNSVLNLLKSLDKIIKFLLGRAQNIGAIIEIIKIVLNQFNGRRKKEEGSKTEKRFLIIVNFFFVLGQI